LGAIATPVQVFPDEKPAGFAPATLMAFTVSGTPPVLVTVRGSDALAFSWVGGNVSKVVDRPTPGGASPMPLNDTDCGLLAALSAILSLADKLPAAVGENVTCTVQLPLGAMGMPRQEFPTVKLAELTPDMLSPLIVSEAPPVLVRTRGKELLLFNCVCGKFSALVDRPTLGGAMPAPLSATACGLLTALSVRVNVAARLVAAAGEKVTCIVQVAFGAMATLRQFVA